MCSLVKECPLRCVKFNTIMRVFFFLQMIKKDWISTQNNLYPLYCTLLPPLFLKPSLINTGVHLNSTPLSKQFFPPFILRTLLFVMSFVNRGSPESSKCERAINYWSFSLLGVTLCFGGQWRGRLFRLAGFASACWIVNVKLIFPQPFFPRQKKKYIAYTL